MPDSVLAPKFGLSHPVGTVLAAIGTRGRRGAARARLVLERYVDGEGLSDGKAERKLVTLLEQLPGSPKVVPQDPVRLLSGKVINVDAGLPDPGGGVELQSYTYHEGLKAWAIDTARAVEAAAVRYLWLPVTPWDVDNRPDRVLDRVSRPFGLELRSEDVA